MEVALGVIALATAVKDLVELGQKIHESFAKVSSNYHKAQSAAKDIKEMVDEIEFFCRSHKDVLDNLENFRLALLGLLSKFRNFDASILPLLPRTGGRRRDRLTQAWDVWRNNHKVEEHILDLQSNIVKVMRKYMMASTMRIEAKQISNHEETIRGLTDVCTNVTQGLQVLAVVERNISAITPVTIPHRLHESSETTGQEFNRSVIMFAQSSPSTSVPMLRMPNIITEEVATTVYIKAQINSIAKLVEKMPTSIPASAQNSVTKFAWAPIAEARSMSITHLRRHIVREVISVHDLLEIGHLQTISIYNGAAALNNFSAALSILGMHHESTLALNWTIKLGRTLVNAFGDRNPYYGARLAIYLVNRSIDYSNGGDNTRSLQAIKEAYKIIQNLQNQYRGETHFQILHSDILLQYAQLVDNQQSVKMCTEAIHILEGILNTQAFTQSQLHEGIIIERVVQPSPPFLDRLFFLAPPITAIQSYAVALQRLGAYLDTDGYRATVLDLVQLAIALRRKMVSVHGHEYKEQLASALYLLVRGRTAHCIPEEGLIALAEECIQLLRELADKNPLFYARQLVSVLWVNAETLESLDRITEAIAIWEEVASLAGQIIQDAKLSADALDNLSDQFRFLERHDDAVRTGRLAITTYQDGVDTQALRYFNLSMDLRQLGRYKESAEAAQTSVTLYRCLVMGDPETWTDDLTEGLADLAYCLAALGDSSAALVAWTESLSMINNLDFLDTRTSGSLNNIGTYCATLNIHQKISHILENEQECPKVSSTTVQRLHLLSGLFPQNADITQQLLLAEHSHAYNLFRVGRLQEAQQYIDNLLDTWSNKPETISESTMALWHATIINMKVDVFDAQGCTKQALLINQSMRDTVKLSAVAFAALSHRNYRRAAEAAREGCDIFTSAAWQINESEYNILSRPSLFAMLASAEANLGNITVAVEYAHRAVDVSLEIRDRKADISATTAERFYMETCGSLAEILLVAGDLAQARQLCKERRAYFSKRVEKRMGEYRNLAPILRMLGILSCSEGRHEEGEAVAKELCKIMKMLGSAFPSLQEEVKIQLRRQTQVPILKVLDEMSEKLDCGHQECIVSLFTF
ncbi:hypothetical protein D9619_008421 [Psilocybe cf. subviscida]|uniref:Uncharacterized protein n=1 Tax=Psilocybe cf. subviscida TaxID=2480587 RepID=A0A8H5BC51_9AGAR|nr:hypothetical protein D9619_008421 [Psilocybe cf. subviscida]